MSGENSSQGTHNRPVYDRLAAHYDRAFSPFEKRFLSRWRGHAFRLIPQNSHTLEIGAGTGLNFVHYPADAKGIASEISSRMLDVARGKSRPQGVSLVQSCAEELPFANSTFDAAVATLVFCSVRSPEQSFKEIRRVLKPGGTVVLLEHVRPPKLLGPLFDLISQLTVPLFEDHFNRRTAEIAAKAGLEIIKIEPRAYGIVQTIVCRV